MTSNKSKNSINENWINYYNALEAIRRSGVCNMWGSDSYLRELYPELSKELSGEILINWMDNYDELYQRLSWHDNRWE